VAVRISPEGLGRLAVELSDLGPVLERVAERAREAILDAGRADTGGDLILSGFARGRVRLDVEVTPSGASVILKATPPGPWTLLEDGSTRESWWIPRYGRTGRVRLPDGGVRRYVRHGAVRAKRTFSRGARTVETNAGLWMDEEISRLVKEAA
jgi:hypothetical protein